MSFAPVLPLGGYAGWAFLNRTLPRQQAAFEAAPALARDEAYFRERIGKVTSAGELVADRRLLKVALGAFGLEGDIDNRFFIRKVFESPTDDPGALAGRLADKRYQQMATAFGFGDGLPHSDGPGFADRLLGAWRERSFEAAVGEQDENLRLALNTRRELAELAADPGSADAKWFTVMGTPPLRKVFETAFGLPTAFGALDIDRQHETLRDKARDMFGAEGIGQFTNPERVEDLIRRFLLRADIAAATGPMLTSGAATALTLLQSAPGLR